MATGRLEDLAGDGRSGLSAQRTTLKVLNFHAHSQTRERIAVRLGAHRSVSHQWFASTGRLLEDHQGRTEGNGLIILGADGNRVLEEIVRNAKRYGSPLTEHEAREMLRGIYRAPHIEFHPTDACNQRCRGCTYEHDDPERRPEAVAFPYDQLQRLATLEPRAVTIVGGGEPTIYREKTHDFVDLVGRLRELLPEAQFGLISNGVRLPRNSVGWANQFKWVRFSVDATVRSTYKTLRGTDDFDRVCDNLVRLLNETNIPSLGVGFVYSRCNISEASAAARFFFDLVMRQCPSALPRFNIAYRPLRRDIQHGDRSDFPEAITASDIAKVELEFVQMAKASPALEKFLREQTNCSDISLGNCHRAQRFTRCGYSTLYRLIRANGDVRPCCMRVAAPGFHLGNLLRDIPETIALNVLYNAAYLRPGCDAQGCKLCGLNRLLESEVRDEDKASIRESPFFG